MTQVMAPRDHLPDMGVMSEPKLIQAALELLAAVLPPTWSVEPLPGADQASDSTFVVKHSSTNMQRTLVVETKSRFAPSDARNLLGSPVARRLLRGTHPAPLLIVAPFLSPRSRQLLTADGHNYLDLAGNTRLVMDQPGLFIYTVGEDRNPIKAPNSTRSLAGAAAGAITRHLLEHQPPVTASTLADATGVNLGQVSRILGYLSSEAIIERTPRAPVTAIDRDALIAYRATALHIPTTGRTADELLTELTTSDPAWGQASSNGPASEPSGRPSPPR